MKTFRALSTTVIVEIDSDVPQAQLAHALVEPYPAVTAAPQLHYRLRATEVWRGPTQLPLEDPLDVVPAFEMDLYEQLVARADDGWVLHAAAIDIEGKALVLCGPSGAGKTTLALAFGERGYRMLTEEVVWIDRAGTVRGLPRPMHVAPNSSRREHLPPLWRQVPYSIRGRDGALRENVLVVPTPDAYQLSELPLRSIVAIDHGPDSGVHLRESAPPVAFGRVWDRSFRQDDAGLETAIHITRAFTSYELSSRTQEQAMTLLDGFLKQL